MYTGVLHKPFFFYFHQSFLQTNNHHRADSTSEVFLLTLVREGKTRRTPFRFDAVSCWRLFGEEAFTGQHRFGRWGWVLGGWVGRWGWVGSKEHYLQRGGLIKRVLPCGHHGVWLVVVNREKRWMWFTWPSTLHIAMYNVQLLEGVKFCSSWLSLITYY